MKITAKLIGAVLLVGLFIALTVESALAFTYYGGSTVGGQSVYVRGQSWRPYASSGEGRFYPAYGYSSYYYPRQYDYYRPYRSFNNYGMYNSGYMNSQIPPYSGGWYGFN